MEAMGKAASSRSLTDVSPSGCFVNPTLHCVMGYVFLWLNNAWHPSQGKCSPPDPKDGRNVQFQGTESKGSASGRRRKQATLAAQKACSDCLAEIN
jgi:hypothetical protein